jgi:hypothetical protein
VDGADDPVELVEERRLHVELSVGEDVDLEPCQESHSRVGGPKLRNLRGEPLGGEAARDGERGRVVGDCDRVVAPYACGRGHLEDGVAAVAPGGVQVEVAAHLVEAHERIEVVG